MKFLFDFGVLMRWRWEHESKQWVMTVEKRSTDSTTQQLESRLHDPFRQNNSRYILLNYSTIFLYKLAQDIPT